MQLDFHYYGTYCAAMIAGYSHEESVQVAYCAQFVDCCSGTFLAKIGGPAAAATTQLQLELMDANTDPAGLQNITRIWASFHFLPKNLYSERKGCSKRYLRKYRLLCDVNSELLPDTVELARGKGPEAAGLAMHVLADTWAHRYFAGTPSLVINNTNYHFTEIVPAEDGFTERPVRFNHNPTASDDLEAGVFVNTVYQGSEHSVMNLGHGRAGHLPDYSFARYRYMPAWAEYREIIKDNPSDYMHAFQQMVYALQCLKDGEVFQIERYAAEAVRPWEDTIREILEKRQMDACADWKSFGEQLSGCAVPDFSDEAYVEEYMAAGPEEKDDTFLGRFILAALAQKSMVTNRIYSSGSPLAGISVDYGKEGFRGIRDFRRLVTARSRSAGPAPEAGMLRNAGPAQEAARAEDRNREEAAHD